MRDYIKLKAFELADALVLMVYAATARFPKEEMFGLTSQIRRAAVSVPSNIVEGCSRNTEKDYLHFLDVAYGSLKELTYQPSLSTRLGYVDNSTELKDKADEAAKVLSGLISALRKPEA